MSVTAAPERQARVLDADHRAATIGMVALVSLIAFEAMAVATAMPTVAAALDGLAIYALAFAAPLATAVIGMVASGAWTDQRGPAEPMWWGLALFVSGLVVAGLVTSMGLVALGRALQGLGGGLVSVALYVVVARVYPEDLRGKVFAGFAAAWVVPALVGPLLAGGIVEYPGWRWVFLAVPVMVLPAAWLVRGAMARVGTQPRSGTWQRGRLVRAVGAAAGAALLHLGGQAGGVERAALLVAGLIALGACVPGLVPSGTWRVRRGLPSVIALRGIVGAGFVAAEVFIPLLLSRERGLSPALAGGVLTAAALTWSTGSWLRSRGRLQQAHGAVIRGGAVAIAVGVVLVATTVSSSVPVLVAVVGWAIAGLGMGMIYPTLSLLALELSPVSEQGLNTSALQLNDSLSSAAMLALSGVLFAALAVASPRAAYLACFAVALALAVAAVVVAPRVRPV